METLQVIVMTFITAAISSAVGAAVGAVVSKFRTVKKASEEARVEAAELKELIKQNTKMTCRLAIYDSHFSMDEKLEAYDIYRKNGWNHQTKKFMDDEMGCDVDEYLKVHKVERS